MSTPNSQVTEQARELLAKETGLTTLEIRLFDGAGGQIEIAQAIRAIEAALTARTEAPPLETLRALLQEFVDKTAAQPAAEEGFVVGWGHWAEGAPHGTRLMRHDGLLAVHPTKSDFYNVPLYAARPQPAQGDGGTK